MKLLTATLLVLISFQTIAQLNTEKRIEFDLRNGYSGDTLFISSKGLFVLKSIKDQKVDGQTEIKYDLYDNELSLLKTETVLIPKSLHLDEIYSNDEAIYEMYSNKKGEFVIVTIQIKDLTNKLTSGSIPPQGKIWKVVRNDRVPPQIQYDPTGSHLESMPKNVVTNMKVIDHYAYFLSRLKYTPVIFKIDLLTGEKTSFPVTIDPYNPKKLFTNNYMVLEKSSEIFLFTQAVKNNKSSEFYMTRIAGNGDVEKNTLLSGINDNNLITVSPYRVDNDKLLLIGTYSKSSFAAEGLFIGEVENGAVNYLRYYNFLDLKDFLSYLPGNMQERIIQKKKKKEQKGKELTKEYDIVNHDIIVLDDGYLFLGEACIPTYIIQNYNTVGLNGETHTYHYTSFDGYYYTHAILGKFSKDGHLMWDVSFKLNPGYKPMLKKQLVAISEQTSTQISMVYTSGNEIVSKTVDFDGNIISDEKWDYIETGNADDKAKRTFSNVDYWYGNNFLAYGSQVIKSGKEKRKVYFVNKIGF